MIQRPTDAPGASSRGGCSPATGTCLVRRDRRADARWRLVCLPYAGGSAAIYHDWQAHVPADVEVIAVELPGHGRRFPEPPLWELSQIIDHVTPALAETADRPYVIFGHSMGALLAYELALAMKARYRRSPLMVVTSASRGPTVPLDRRPLHALPQAEFFAELRRFGGIPGEVLAHGEALRLFEPALRADFAIVDRYRRESAPPLERPLLVLGAVDDSHVSQRDLQAWSSVGGRPLAFLQFEGGHFFLHDKKNDVPGSIVRSAQKLLGLEDADAGWC